jgi:4-hydroxy-3-methylbut-2-enyl diphosphate reductase IspH
MGSEHVRTYQSLGDRKATGGSKSISISKVAKSPEEIIEDCAEKLKEIFDGIRVQAQRF